MRKEIDVWASGAIRTGHFAVARRHAPSLLRMAPFSLNSGRLTYSATRGRVALGNSPHPGLECA